MTPTISLFHHLFSPWSVRGDSRVVASERVWRDVLNWKHAIEFPLFVDGDLNRKRPRVWVGVDVFEDWQGPFYTADGSKLLLTLDKQFTTDPNNDYPRIAIAHDVRDRLFALIDRTPHLDWMICTERLENVARMMPPAVTNLSVLKRTGHHEQYRENLWLGTRVSTQAEADARIPKLLEVPARVRFAEVVVTGEIDFQSFQVNRHATYDALSGCGFSRRSQIQSNPNIFGNKIDLLILRGETGPDARPCPIDAVQSLVRQGKEAGVAVWVENVGSRVVGCKTCHDNPYWARTLSSWKRCPDCALKGPRHPDGADPMEWPEDLRVRQLPNGME